LNLALEISVFADDGSVRNEVRETVHSTPFPCSFHSGAIGFCWKRVKTNQGTFRRFVLIWSLDNGRFGSFNTERLTGTMYKRHVPLSIEHELIFTILGARRFPLRNLAASEATGLTAHYLHISQRNIDAVVLQEASLVAPSESVVVVQESPEIFFGDMDSLPLNPQRDFSFQPSPDMVPAQGTHVYFLVSDRQI
jgi:hypothetical protein